MGLVEVWAQQLFWGQPHEACQSLRVHGIRFPHLSAQTFHKVPEQRVLGLGFRFGAGGA